MRIVIFSEDAENVKIAVLVNGYECGWKIADPRCPGNVLKLQIPV
ncbi:MAG: hypothetical protein AB1546_12455 [bacterium]